MLFPPLKNAGNVLHSTLRLPVLDGKPLIVCVAGGVLETTALLRRLAFVCHQFVKVGIDDARATYPMTKAQREILKRSEAAGGVSSTDYELAWSHYIA